MTEALFIQVNGIVQGVGFRPFVYRCAKRFLITGWVLNAKGGVQIHAEGESKLLDEFVLELADHAPAAARVESIELAEVPLEHFETFEIRFSDDADVEDVTLVSPDLATCDACVAELFDPQNRRYRYPFINCTDCGPRFTIIESLPYDRPQTSMSKFMMCKPCAYEYIDPENRRFHAQPNACFDCGPHVSWKLAGSDEVLWGMTREESDAIFAEAVALLQRGGILAVKGLGGFHLACDANNPQALATLRERKRRKGKGFACMVSSVDQVRDLCHVSADEEALLKTPARPIVLLRKREGAEFAVGLADGLSELGVMLPATPVQHLLLHDFGGMLVMTSGNLHDEPIQIDDALAYEALASVADAFLGNDREIRARYDDSVVRMLRAGETGSIVQVIRRARGYAPAPIPLPDAVVGRREDGTPKDAPSVFAVGPEQKVTLCLTRPADAFVSQHIGDVEHAETFDAWVEAGQTFQRLFDITPAVVARDLHPEYLTSKWADRSGLPVFPVQHHHAHIVSAMAENNLPGPVCGIAFDGTGYGVDGAIWGGEVLLANLQAFERFANFAYVPMPGGAAAIKDPLRMAYGALWAFDLLEHPGAAEPLAALGESAASMCGQMIDRGLNTPMTSSMGRLFDAASALLGVCRAPRYEGEGAILLEAAIDLDAEVPGDPRRYEVGVLKNTATSESTAQDTSVVLLDAAPTFAALLDDLAAGAPVGAIARCFHDAMVRLVVNLAESVRMVYDISTVVLSGGVFMNRYLMEHALLMLEEGGFTVAINRDLPPNDACISYGQAVITRANLTR